MQPTQSVTITIISQPNQQPPQSATILIRSYPKQQPMQSKANPIISHPNQQPTYVFIKITPSEKTFSKLFSQKVNFQNCSLKKNIILIFNFLIYTSSESLEYISRSSVICLTPFFLFHSISTLLKTLVFISFKSRIYINFC